MNIIQTTGQFFQLAFTAIVAVIVGRITANLLPKARANMLKIDIPLLIMFALALTLLIADSILQVFWNVNNSFAISNELVLLIRSIFTFLCFIVFCIFTLIIAKKTGWLKVITAFVLVALSVSFIDRPLPLPTISPLQAFWLLSYGLAVTLSLVSFAVVRSRKSSRRQPPPPPTETPETGEEEKTEEDSTQHG